MMKATTILSAPKMPALIILAMLFLLIGADLLANQPYKKKDPGAPVGYEHPENPDDLNNTAARLTRYEVKKPHRAGFRKLARKYVRHSLRQRGNILSELYYEEEDPSVMWIIERWKNKNELDKISKRARFRILESLSKKVLEQPAKVIHVQDLEPLSRREWRSVVNRHDKPVTIMLFVDAKPGTEDDFKKTYHAAMPQFRSEPGVITYQLSQLEGDSTQFVTYEKFRGEDAFQYHLKFPPTQPVIDYLTINSKTQPFQAGLHRLIALRPRVRN